MMRFTALYILAALVFMLLVVDCHHATEPPIPGPDTTDHEFSWALDMFGDGGSDFRDVVVINDTLAYAVGEIYFRDSLGNWDPNAYNAAKWNGARWELIRIPFVGSCSAVYSPPLRAIWALSQTSILVSNRGSLVRFDGANAILDCRMNTLLTGAINKIFAFDSNNVYAVGNAGNIVHYVNGAWQLLQSGTAGTIQDIWGGTDSKTGQRVVLCAVAEAYSMGAPRILRIGSNDVVDTLAWVPGRRPYSVWFESSSQIFTCGDGVFMRDDQNRWNEIAGADVIPTFTERVRGQYTNDLFVVGDFGVIAHYNGATFHIFSDFADILWYSCAYKHNHMIAVGELSGRAVVLRMWR